MADAKVVSWIEAGRLPDGRTGYRLTVVTPKPIDTGAAFTAVVGSCATCRWAGYPMTIHNLMPCGRDRSPNGASAGFIGGVYPLLVRPDFGCVQWEGK